MKFQEIFQHEHAPRGQKTERTTNMHPSCQIQPPHCALRENLNRGLNHLNLTFSLRHCIQALRASRSSGSIPKFRNLFEFLGQDTPVRLSLS